MITLKAGPEDFLRCRFAVSPLWETLAAVRIHLYPAQHATQRALLRELTLPSLDLDVLPLLLPEIGYTPDFLTPPPTGPRVRFEDELQQVLATPTDRVAAELRRALSLHGGNDPRAARMLEDPGRTRDRLVAVIDRLWRDALVPGWPEVQDLLSADVAYQSRRLARSGLQGLLSDLHPAVSVRGDLILVDSPTIEDHRDLGGDGLILMPTAFGRRTVLALTDHPWQPTLIYPARGISAIRRPAPPRADRLVDLIGGRRAEVLDAIELPISTTRLARALGRTPSTISRHLKVLEYAGLASSHRVGWEVLYRRTELGHRLVGRPDGEARGR